MRQLTLAEWQELFEKYENEWGDEVAALDAATRAVYFAESAEMPTNLKMLAALFHSHYIAAYLADTLAKSGLYPQDVLDGIALESVKLGKAAAADDTQSAPDDSDPDEMINMPGGEA